MTKSAFLFVTSQEKEKTQIVHSHARKTRLRFLLFFYEEMRTLMNSDGIAKVVFEEVHEGFVITLYEDGCIAIEDIGYQTDPTLPHIMLSKTVACAVSNFFTRPDVVQRLK